MTIPSLAIELKKSNIVRELAELHGYVERNLYKTGFKKFHNNGSSVENIVIEKITKEERIQQIYENARKRIKDRISLCFILIPLLYESGKEFTFFRQFFSFVPKNRFFIPR